MTMMTMMTGMLMTMIVFFPGRALQAWPSAGARPARPASQDEEPDQLTCRSTGILSQISLDPASLRMAHSTPAGQECGPGR